VVIFVLASVCMCVSLRMYEYVCNTLAFEILNMDRSFWYREYIFRENTSSSHQRQRHGSKKLNTSLIKRKSFYIQKLANEYSPTPLCVYTNCSCSDCGPDGIPREAFSYSHDTHTTPGLPWSFITHAHPNPCTHSRNGS